MLHSQADHAEIVVIFDGEADFLVGDETRHVQAGDMIFIPRNTLHGPIIPEGGKLSLLSMFSPFFDLSKKNIAWDRETKR